MHRRGRVRHQVVGLAVGAQVDRRGGRALGLEDQVKLQLARSARSQQPACYRGRIDRHRQPAGRGTEALQRRHKLGRRRRNVTGEVIRDRLVEPCLDNVGEVQRLADALFNYWQKLALGAESIDALCPARQALQTVEQDQFLGLGYGTVG